MRFKRFLWLLLSTVLWTKIAMATPVDPAHIERHYGLGQALRTECIVMYNTAGILDTDDVTTVFRTYREIVLHKIWCETAAGTVTMDLQIDDGTPADVMGTDLVCDSTSEEDDTLDTASSIMAPGDRLDFAVTAVASAPTRLTVCFEYSF